MTAPTDTTCAHRWPRFHPPDEDGWQAETCADCGARLDWHRAE